MATAKKIRIHEFSTSNPSLWFLTAESLFRVNEIKDESEKFGYLLQSLNMDHLEKIQRVVEDAETLENGVSKELQPYTKSKQLLLKHYNDSEEEKLRKLFETTASPTTQKPTEILAEIRKHGSKSVPETVIRELWWGRLSNEIKAYLTSCQSLSLDKLADQADMVTTLLHRVAEKSVACITETRSSMSSSSDRDSLFIKALQDMQREIAELKIHRSRSRTPHRRDSFRSPSRSPSPHYRRNYSASKRQSQHRNFHSSKDRPIVLYNGECWYHYTFGDRSKKCVQTCKHFNSFKPPEN